MQLIRILETALTIFMKFSMPGFSGVINHSSFFNMLAAKITLPIIHRSPSSMRIRTSSTHTMVGSSGMFFHSPLKRLGIIVWVPGFDHSAQEGRTKAMRVYIYHQFDINLLLAVPQPPLLKTYLSLRMSINRQIILWLLLSIIRLSWKLN